MCSIADVLRREEMGRTEKSYAAPHEAGNPSETDMLESPGICLGSALNGHSYNSYLGVAC